ncbi:hypothetical protein AGMMS50293_03090 [Spirochaetia bacterium]|nr:hypothetical protein AGMMS50293_03090 [Spirochaetia bacterium]
MKKLSIGFFVLMTVLVIAGCATTPPVPSVLEGTWVLANPGRTIVFTGNKFKTFVTSDPGDVRNSGSFKLNDAANPTEITFNNTSGATWKQAIVLNSGNFVLSDRTVGSGNNILGGTYTKN